jgi:hypothetical protein
LHQGRFVALCAMNLAGNTCNDDDVCIPTSVSAAVSAFHL